MYWGAHPQIVRQLVVGAVLPTLYFAAPVWAAASRHPHRMSDIERVLAAAGRLVCGLGRHAPGEGALALAGFRLPAVELRSRVAGFWARMAAYGEDLRECPPPCATRRGTPPRVDTAQDILAWDLARLEEGGILPADVFDSPPAIEGHALCPFAPWRERLPVDVRMESPELAMDSFWRSRATSAPSTVWVVTDGSVTAEGAGAAALLYRGNGAPFASEGLRSTGLHSSTRMEVEAIGLGLALVDEHIRGRRDVAALQLASDSQAAILAVTTGHSTTMAARRARLLILRALEAGCQVSVSWVPGHAGIPENEAADHAAKAAGKGNGTAEERRLPHCAQGVRRRIEAYFDREMQQR